MSELSVEMLAEKVPGQKQDSPEFATASVGAVTASGLRLVFPGEETASEKVYKCNATVKFEVGDRVKVTADSGTYVIDFPLGAPMARYPIPPGGSDGQTLIKDGSANYAVKWASVASAGLPSAGTNGQVLTKDGSADYAVKWADPPSPLPAGGSSGQVLAKRTSVNYDVQWTNPPSADNPLPTGGTNGQFLMKSGSANYAVTWGNASATSIANGTYALEMSALGTITPSRGNAISLGTSSSGLKDLYADGTIVLGNSYGGSIKLGGSSAKLGFFGTTPQSRAYLASTATVSALISALKTYGLFS